MQIHPSKSLKECTEQMDATILDIACLLEISAEELCSILGLSRKLYNAWRTRRTPLSIMALFRLANHFNLSVDALFRGDLDLVALREHYKGNLNYVAEKYKIAPHSRVRTVHNYLNYLEYHYGVQYRRSVLRSLQTTEFALLNPSEPINLKLVTDVGDAIVDLGIPDKEFFNIGFSSYDAFKTSPLGVNLSQSGTVLRTYEKLFYELLGYLENNCDYTLTSVRDQLLVIRVTSLPDVAEALRVNHLGSRNLCAYKAGVFASVPKYLGYPAARVQEVRCVHHGDSACDFEVHFDSYSIRSLEFPSTLRAQVLKTAH